MAPEPIRSRPSPDVDPWDQVTIRLSVKVALRALAARLHRTPGEQVAFMVEEAENRAIADQVVGKTRN